jgi:hypothetical protein
LKEPFLLWTKEAKKHIHNENKESSCLLVGWRQTGVLDAWVSSKNKDLLAAAVRKNLPTSQQPRRILLFF